MSDDRGSETMRLVLLGLAPSLRMALRGLLADGRFSFVDAASPAEMPAGAGAADLAVADSAWLAQQPAAARAALRESLAGAAALIVLGDAGAVEPLPSCRRVLQAPAEAMAVAQLIDGLRDDLLGRPLPAAVIACPADAVPARERELQAARCTAHFLAADDLATLPGVPEAVALIVDVAPGEAGRALVEAARATAARRGLPLIFLAPAETWPAVPETTAEDEFWLHVPAAAGQLAALVRPVVRAARARARLERLFLRQLAIQHQEFTLLRGAIDQHVIISMADADGRITYANDRFCELSGFSREELLGANHSLIKSGRHSREFYADLWRTITRGEIWHGEVCNRKKNGEPYWVSATIVPVMDEAGKPLRYVSTRTDITLLKKIQDELLASRQQAAHDAQRIQAIFDSLPVGIFWKDRELRYRGANRRFLDDVGVADPEHLNGLDDTGLFAPEVAETYRRCDREVLESGRPLPPFEERLVLPGGGERWLRTGKMPQFDDQGQVTGVLGAYLDITDLKETERKLREITERLKFFADNVEEGVVVCDQGMIVDVSDRWLELFRCRRDDALGRPVMSFTAPSAVPMALQLIGDRWAESYESVMLRHDGTTFPAVVRGRNLEFGGRELRLTSILDISRQKENELAVQAAKTEAERANQAKSEFLSSMSHELRTPMNAIFGFAQILEFDERLDADQQDSVQEILKAARHLLGLINEVLDLAKIESGRIALSLETVLLGTVVEECEQLLRPLAAEREISLHVPAGPPGAVRADKVRLKQVLLNLLSNAIKYNRSQGEVRLTVDTAGPRLRITVADTGPGIAAGDLAGLFQPFNRLGAEHGTIEGTGIGLAISRRLIEAMGGRIGVDSAPGEGSRFWVELPQAAPETAQAGGQDAPRRAESGADGLQRHILYVDDNPVNLKLVAQILGRLRHIRLVTAHTPELGIELALAGKPDLILLDINLPGMDGYEMLQVLKADLQLRHVPVLAVSANAMPRDIERGIAAGFADYLTKPLDVGRFLASIDRHLPEGEHP
ncbi:PAS domain-containing hybrid sensor histidine kinase/response regulator [Pseudothauera rhizosphaerae]|nr:PAS domain-containing hybrid sensor histidine kinase/response regulator [Pseudothauera rhizosphaerae]